jgi:hypothetical protein
MMQDQIRRRQINPPQWISISARADNIFRTPQQREPLSVPLPRIIIIRETGVVGAGAGLVGVHDPWSLAADCTKVADGPRVSGRAVDGVVIVVRSLI